MEIPGIPPGVNEEIFHAAMDDDVDKLEDILNAYESDFEKNAPNAHLIMKLAGHYQNLRMVQICLDKFSEAWGFLCEPIFVVGCKSNYDPDFIMAILWCFRDYTINMQTEKIIGDYRGIFLGDCRERFENMRN